MRIPSSTSCRRGLGDEPPVAQSGHPPHRGLGAASDPYGRKLLLDRLGLHRHVAQGEVPSPEGDVVLGPEAPHHPDGLVGPPRPLGLAYAARLELALVLRAQADGRQRSTAGQEVQGGDLLGQDRRIPEGERQNAGPELEFRRPGGDEGEGDYRLHAQHRGDDPCRSAISSRRPRPRQTPRTAKGGPGPSGGRASRRSRRLF